jgi:hypothetical protein
MADLNDDELLDALGVDVAPLKASTRTPREERIIAGFEDILRFHQERGRAPLHGEQRDIFERLYAVRLNQLRKLPEARALLAPMDAPGLLTGAADAASSIDNLDGDDLLAQLGVNGPDTGQDDITVLKNVRTFEERRAADEIAIRNKCVDFEKFEPLFEKVKNELQAGVRKTIRLETRSLDEIQQGTFFVVGGQVAYVAEERDEFTTKYERRDMRLRVIYDNGTESDVLSRSLQRALHRDDMARVITEPSVGPLFGDQAEPDDVEAGTIYVLRSLSEHPFISEHRQLIHKIGVTGGSVQSRIANAEKDATYLLAGVEVVATYKLHNLNRTKLENVFHRLFASAQIDLIIADRFGNPVKPREWFFVPLQVIDEAVQRIRDGSITSVNYDLKTARLSVGSDADQG